MTDVWSQRAEAYRTSAIHSAGEDLDLVVEWCEPAAGVTVLDVATRLLDQGLQFCNERVFLLLFRAAEGIDYRICFGSDRAIGVCAQPVQVRRSDRA